MATDTSPFSIPQTITNIFPFFRIDGIPFFLLIQSVFLLLGIGMLMKVFRERRERPLITAIRFLGSIGKWDDEGTTEALGLFGKALNGNVRDCAITELITLSIRGYSTSMDALKKHISSKDLRRVLRQNYDDPFARFWSWGLPSEFDAIPLMLSGENSQKEHGKKLLCFMIGERKIEELDAAITLVERQKLHDRFAIRSAKEISVKT